MTGGAAVLPLAGEEEPVRFVVIDDEPHYRARQPAIEIADRLLQVGDYGSVDTFLAVQREPCHVVVLDLCLDNRRSDRTVTQGVVAVRLLAEQFGHRVLVHSADGRPDPVARCVAAGALGYVSKYSPEGLFVAIEEIGRHGRIVTPELEEALRLMVRRAIDISPSQTVQETLVLLQRGATDAEVAAARNVSVRTVEDHKMKILSLYGAYMEEHRVGFEGLARDLGLAPGDLVNDEPGARPRRGFIASRMPWSRKPRT